MEDVGDVLGEKMLAVTVDCTTKRNVNSTSVWQLAACNPWSDRTVPPSCQT